MSVSFTPETCIMARGLEPLIIGDCKICDWYTECKARKDFIDQARKSWFFHDGELQLEDRVDVAIIKLIQRRGYEEASGDLIEVFSSSRVIVEALLLFNTHAELHADDFKHLTTRANAHRIMGVLEHIELVKKIGPATWRINA